MTNHWHGPGHPEYGQLGCDDIDCSDYKRTEPLDIEVERSSDIYDSYVLVRLNPNEARDLAWAVSKADPFAFSRKYYEWAHDLEVAANSIYPDDRPGLRIVMVPR